MFLASKSAAAKPQGRKTRSGIIPPGGPKNKVLLRKGFIFIQSEGLVCNRRKAYVICSQSELHVIKSQDLYVPFLRID